MLKFDESEGGKIKMTIQREMPTLMPKFDESEGGKIKMTTQHEMPTPMPEFDEDGFLIDSEKWSKDIAEILAQKEVPRGLTGDHWTAVDFMREYYITFGTVPPVRILVRRTELSLRRLKELFPSGLTKGACKIAGIPRSTIRPNFLYP